MANFQYRAYSDHPEIKRYSEILMEAMLCQYERKPNPKRISKLTKWMRVAVAGIYLAGGYRQESIRITTNRNTYHGKTQRSVMHQPELLDCFNWLIQNQYLEKEQSAHQEDGDTWVATSYLPTRKWLDLICQVSPIDASKEQITKSITRNPTAPVIELRQGKERIRLKPHPQKKWWTDRINAYNRRLEAHEFKFGNECLSPLLLSLTRIFNDGSYDRGGRYYSTFQGLNSQTRQMLTIDGEMVAEVDYKNLHPSLLYQREGLAEPKFDAYIIDGYPRDIVKKAFNILINRKKPAPATNSLIFYLNKKSKKKKPQKHPQEVSIDSDYCITLEQEIRKLHQPIEHLFCTGVGLELQRHDSELCSFIMDYFLVKTKSIVIPVHDSFIVKQSDLPLLAEAMRYAEINVAKLMNRTFREPRIDVEAIRYVDNYDDLIAKLGKVNKTNITEEESVIPEHLLEALEELDEIEELSDEDAVIEG